MSMFWCFFVALVLEEDKRRRRKGGSRLSEARKRGRAVLYQLTSRFSRRPKGDVNLGGVSTPRRHKRVPHAWQMKIKYERV